jgi:tight adherence protein B
VTDFPPSACPHALAASLTDGAALPLLAGGAAVVAWLLAGSTIGRWLDRRRARADETARSMYLPEAPWLWGYGAPVLAFSTFAVFALLGMAFPAVLLAAFVWMAVARLPALAKKRRKRLFEARFVDAIVGLSNGLKAGMSLPQALEQVARDTDGPVSEEFKHILSEYALGKTIDQAFEDAAPRIDSRNFDLVKLAFRVGKQRGGNLSEVFEKIAASIREIWRLEEHIRTVSTEGRSSARFMTMMPPIFLVLLWVMDAKAMTLLFTDPLGIGILTVVVIINVMAHLWIRKILDVDV